MRVRYLARGIAARTALVTLAVVLLGALSAFFVYYWVFENHPEAVASPQSWVPEVSDYIVITAAVLTAIGVSTLAGVQLARRIILPLTSLAATARKITDGDLSARAVVDDRSLQETAMLVDDFNRMADRLEGLTDGMIAWNAKIAHELRTPVTILKGRLEGVADGVFAVDSRTLDSLLRQVDGLARVVEDLRVVSLADSGHLDLRLETIDLAQVVGDLRAVVEPPLTAAGFRVVWRLDTAVAVADPTRIRQAALALIENARLHATPGALTIHTARTEDRVRLSVTDKGPGVAADRAATLFDAFMRGAGETSGSGLGLAVVRAIADAHGGRAFHQAVRSGSQFTLETPVRPLPDTPTPSSS